MARRRLLLVAAGGVAIGVATVIGRGGGHLAPSALDEGPHTGPTHPPVKAKATSSAKPERAVVRRATNVPPARLTTCPASRWSTSTTGPTSSR